MSDKSSKTMVVDPESGSRVPFLRGILTRSLQQSGLGFKEAYKLAELIRREIAQQPEIDREALRVKVARKVAHRHGELALQHYQYRADDQSPVQVVDPDGQQSPFLATRLSRSLEAASLEAEQAAQVSARVAHRLQALGRATIDEAELSRITYRDLVDHYGEALAKRYLLWLEFWRSGRPLILLVGGVNGVGKSSIAAYLSLRMDIVRIQSTDMLREVMRKMISKQLLPAIHRSSFRAWEALPDGYSAVNGSEELVVDGFLTQAEQVAVAMDAVLKRALNERVPMILEGIHLHPAYMRSVSGDDDAIVVPCMLAELDAKRLRKKLRGRSVEAPSRRSEHYLNHFDMIWQLQSFLLSEADRCRVAIISELNTGRVGHQVQELIFGELERRFQGDPKKLFGR